MVRFPRYKATYSTRETSVFSPGAQSLLKLLGDSLYEPTDTSVQLSAFRNCLKSLSPYAYRIAQAEIRDLAGLYYSHLMPRADTSHRNTLENKFQQEVDLPFLLLFDGNGYNRERALSKIRGRLKSPIEVIALADLANNWVEPVRQAALIAIDRSYPDTDPNALAGSFSFLAQNQKSWKRWSKDASQRVMSYFHKPEVMELVAKRLEAGKEPRGSRTLSYALQSENFDPYLERILRGSKDASLRARALTTLLNWQAAWVTDYKWKWIDKSLGKRKRVAAISTRKLSIQPLKKPLLLAALTDKSAQIRKIAAQGVIDHGKELGLPIAEIALQLELDSSENVRRRGEYLNHKIRKNKIS